MNVQEKMCIRDRSKDGHVFPVPSNGRCNTILKELGRQCGFKIQMCIRDRCDTDQQEWYCNL